MRLCQTPQKKKRKTDLDARGGAEDGRGQARNAGKQADGRGHGAGAQLQGGVQLLFLGSVGSIGLRDGVHPNATNHTGKY